MKREIELFDYAGNILKQLKSGILITAKVGDKVNPMAIAWGSLGIEWNRTVFITYVRENRFTRELLDQNSEFTVNLPLNEERPDIIAYCGRNSGRDVDKVKALNLTLVDSDTISVPAIKELPLTLECKIIHKKLQDKKTMPEAIKERFYPQDVDSDFFGSNKDYHIAYYGEVLKAYICG